MQYCILGTCTYSPSIVPRIYLPPTCEPASLSGPSTSRGTSSGVAWPLGLARRHLNPVMPSCHRIDDFQSRQSPQREAVSSWSIGDFRAMPYLGVVAVVSSRGGDIERSGQPPNAWTREITLFAYSVPSRPNHETNKPRFQFMHPWIHINTTVHSTTQVYGIATDTPIVQCPVAVR